MPKRSYETDNPFGQKLLQVLAERGTPGDLPALANAFGVAVPSTYDWIRHGRFAKDRYADLVTWSGRSLHWWFDCPPVASEQSAPRTLEEPTAPYGRPPWPFPNISERRVCSMPIETRLKLQAVLTPVLDMLAPNQSETAA
jgi:hypothetical protein